MSNFYIALRKEVKGNQERKIRVFIFLLLISNHFTLNCNLFVRIIGRCIGSFYAFFSGWILGIDISYMTKIGHGLKISHGIGLVVNPGTIIGENVWLRQNTTIGNTLKDSDAPIIGNNVNIGANVVIIGKIKIGDNSIIGAGSVVTMDIPANCTVVGNPARIIKE